MGALFGPDFERRADLKRRQDYHQALLDSLRFGRVVPSAEVAAESRDPTTEGRGAGSTGLVGGALWVLGIVLFAFTIPAVLLSAVAALPIGGVLMFWVRALAGQPVDRYGGFYRAALSGIFCFLTVTACTATVYAVIQAPHTTTGIVGDFWAVLSPRALGFQRAMAMTIPGVLACAGIWSRRIGRPFRSWKGYLWALACAALCVPTSIAALSVALIRLLR